MSKHQIDVGLRLDVLKAADAGLELVHEGEARRCR